MEYIKDYINKSRLVSHHISPFNDLLARGMQTIINREPPLINDEHKISISFGHVHVENPQYVHFDRSVRDMFPNYARKHNVTYEGVIYCDVIINKDSKTTHNSRVPIGKLPIMLRSSACNLTRYGSVTEHEECRNDPGGYFIIKGKERVLVGQIRPAYNRVYTFKCKVGEKYVYSSEIRSMNASGISVLVKALIDSDGRCYFSLPYIKTILPAGVVFKALNIEKQLMIRMIKVRANSFELQLLQDQYDECSTTDDAINRIADSLPDDKKSDGHDVAVAYVKSILRNELFYHIGMLTETKCAQQLAYILKRLISVSSGSIEVDDKHNLANKRLDSSGNLVAFIFNGLFKQFVKTLSTQLKNATKNGDPLTIVKNINSLYTIPACFMASNWTTQKASSAYSREGVSQVLSVQNYGARMSHLRRVMLTNGVKGKNANARHLHASHISFLCPYETPEGERVGLVTNLALTVDVSCDVPSHEILVVVEQMDNFSADTLLNNATQIFINGRLVGSCIDAPAFVNEFNIHRSTDLIDDIVSCAYVYHHNEIHIWSDEGRFIRPLIQTDTREVVFRDVYELEQSVVAMNESDLKRNKCDYIEICPAGTMMSVMASVIPFANHSQSPRNAYQASMGKQAIGIPVESFKYRYDTTLHIHNYPQKPLTRSEMVNIIKFDEMSHGAMPIVAIMTRCGYNQEDSIILNKSSIDRGLFVATTYFTLTEEEKKRGKSDFDTFCMPKLQYRRHDVNYSYLDETTGIIRENTSIILRAGDAIIGKTSNRMITNADGVRSLDTKDSTIVIKVGEEGVVDSVLRVTNDDGIKIVKIRIRSTRIPEIGDKFASSTAQKGTCGMIYRQEDMPFDKDGICPDLIINPHAIPSRMTINMLIEQCFNLIGCKLGKSHDATTFAHPNVESELANGLKSIGFSEFTSQLYCGFTGAKFPCKTFIAPAFYQRLKHMVSDKIHARMAGPLDKLTHQPVAGRSREGGLRVGEMEQCNTLAGGVSRMVKEFMYDLSDKYSLPVCTNCGQIPLNKSECQTCKESSQIEEKNTPYAAKLLYQLLQGMGVNLKIS